MPSVVQRNVQTVVVTQLCRKHNTRSDTRLNTRHTCACVWERESVCARETVWVHKTRGYSRAPGPLTNATTPESMPPRGAEIQPPKFETLTGYNSPLAGTNFTKLGVLVELQVPYPTPPPTSRCPPGGRRYSPPKLKFWPAITPLRRGATSRNTAPKIDPGAPYPMPPGPSR